MVRNLKDESENQILTEQFIFRVFQDLKRKKIKEKVKFKTRMGPEFDRWAFSLEQEFPKELLVEILNDDDFWEKTLKVTKL